MSIVVKWMRSLLLLGMLLAGLLIVASVAVGVEVGETAPDFTLPSTTGEKISLNQFRGRNYVLLEFYIRDFGGT